MSRDLGDRMRKPCEHMEEMQKSASTRLLRNEKEIDSFTQKKIFCEVIVYKARQKNGVRPEQVWPCELGNSFQILL